MGKIFELFAGEENKQLRENIFKLIKENKIITKHEIEEIFRDQVEELREILKDLKEQKTIEDFYKDDKKFYKLIDIREYLAKFYDLIKEKMMPKAALNKEEKKLVRKIEWLIED